MAGVDIRREIDRHGGTRWNEAPAASGRARATAQEAVAGIVAWLGQGQEPGGAPAAAVLAGPDDAYGLGPLTPLVRDPNVQDVLVVGPERVFAEVHGRLERQPIAFDDDEAVVALAQRLAAPLGRELTVAQPFVDARVDALGLRLTATVPPFSRQPTLSLRKTRQAPLGDDALLASGFADRACLDLLAGAVRARLNIVVFGPTGAGKTTLARHLGRSVPAAERIVTIEETLELGLAEVHPHVVELETRVAPRGGGMASIDMDEALRQVLHMRPDRIVVGEVRGREALTLVMALGTGHGGSWTTLHASGAEEVFDRLAFAMLLAAPEVEPASLRRLAAQAVDLVVGVRRDARGHRYVACVCEVVRGARGQPLLRTLAEHQGGGVWRSPEAPSAALAARLAEAAEAAGRLGP